MCLMCCDLTALSSPKVFFVYENDMENNKRDSKMQNQTGCIFCCDKTSFNWNKKHNRSFLGLNGSNGRGPGRHCEVPRGRHKAAHGPRAARSHFLLWCVSLERPIVTPEEAAEKVTGGHIALNQEQSDEIRLWQNWGFVVPLHMLSAAFHMPQFFPSSVYGLSCSKMSSTYLVACPVTWW